MKKEGKGRELNKLGGRIDVCVCLKRRRKEGKKERKQGKGGFGRKKKKSRHLRQINLTDEAFTLRNGMLVDLPVLCK